MKSSMKRKTSARLPLLVHVLLLISRQRHIALTSITVPNSDASERPLRLLRVGVGAVREDVGQVRRNALDMGQLAIKRPSNMITQHVHELRSCGNNRPVMVAMPGWPSGTETL